jgi:hypothetical protein
MNQTLRIAGGIALFCLGVLAGLFLRRDRGEPAPRPSSEVQRTPAVAESKPRSETPRAAADVATLEARIRELEADVRMGRATAATPEGALTPAALEELFEAYLELEGAKNPDPEKGRVLFARLGQLNEKSAGYFVEKFRKSKGPDLEKERAIAMELALASGGSAVTDFVNVLLNDPSLDPALRANLLDELGGMNGGLFSIRRLPINDELSSTAMAMCRSGKPEDRKAAAGLLGGLKTEASRIELRRLVDEDKDSGVRTAAVLSLGHVGDPSTRTYLERLWASPESHGKSGQEIARLRDAIASALKELEPGPR